ncbi:MAG: PD40 domain-containing protein [Planctomycetes bacterium]|nr:PD40 domain-containing protein [Planctomycetota bacterium]MBI3844799.1 PD40 domain-containing protein [Planctomycetota bacterium]
MNRLVSSIGRVALFVSSVALTCVGQTTTRVSVAASGAQANFDSVAPALSGDGRYIAFLSGATNLIPHVTPLVADVFVRDRWSGSVALASVTLLGIPGSGANPSISADGRFVAFESHSNEIVPGDTNECVDDRDPNNIVHYHCGDVFVRDLQTATTIRVSVTSSGQQANNDSGSPRISADGSTVAFVSYASNLAAVDQNGTTDVFMRDLVTRTTLRMSMNATGQGGNSASGNFGVAISADGRFVAFNSYATNLVSGDTNNAGDIFVRDRMTGAVMRASVGAGGVQANAESRHPSISADGRFVAFESAARNLVAPATSGRANIFVRDLEAGVTERVSVGLAGAEANEGSYFPVLSADGRYVAFSSLSSNLVPGDTNHCPSPDTSCQDVFVFDRQTGTTSRVSVGAFGEESNDQSGASEYFGSPTIAISQDGRFVAYPSKATNLVPGDTNGRMDLFVRDRLDCESGDVAQSTNVLHVNGSSGDSTTHVVSASTGAPITVSLDPSPAGPDLPGYVVWAWRGIPTNAFFVLVNGDPIGCAANPNPLNPRLPRPQPFRCVMGGFSALYCGSVPTLGGSPISAPWSLTRAQGFMQPLTITLQGVIADSGATNSHGLSVTNAVVLRIQ